MKMKRREFIKGLMGRLAALPFVGKSTVEKVPEIVEFPKPINPTIVQVEDTTGIYLGPLSFTEVEDADIIR